MIILATQVFGCQWTSFVQCVDVLLHLNIRCMHLGQVITFCDLVVRIRVVVDDMVHPFHSRFMRTFGRTTVRIRRFHVKIGQNQAI